MARFFCGLGSKICVGRSSVADPDPKDLHHFAGSSSIIFLHGSGSGSRLNLAPSTNPPLLPRCTVPQYLPHHTSLTPPPTYLNSSPSHLFRLPSSLNTAPFPLLPHHSLFLPHPLPLLLHTSTLLPHISSVFPHPSTLLPFLSFHITHLSSLIPHPSRLSLPRTPHISSLLIHPSPLLPNLSSFLPNPLFPCREFRPIRLAGCAPFVLSI